MAFELGGKTYEFDVSRGTNIYKNIGPTGNPDFTGHFYVKVNGTSTKIDSAEMLFLIYAARQTTNTQRVEKNSVIAENLANYANAVSNLTKVFGLYAASFDGEFFKQGMGPDGAIGVVDDKDWEQSLPSESTTKFTDINVRNVFMTKEHVMEVLSNYKDAIDSYNALSGEATYLKDKLHVTLGDPPKFPFGDTFIDYSVTGNYSKLAAADNPIEKMQLFSKGDNTTNPTYGESNITNFLSGWGGDFINSGFEKNENFVNSSAEAIAKGYKLTNKIGLSSKAGGTISLSALGDEPTQAQKDANLALLALHYARNGLAVLDGSASTEWKETFNNEMNKTNTNTQTVTQNTSRDLGRLEALQNMIDRNMSKIFDNFGTIARGG